MPLSDKKVIIAINELINPYVQCLGQEGAQKIISDAIRSQQLIYKNEYTKEEAKKILEFLKSQEGFVAILAGILLSRIVLRNQ
jgi:membrane protein CcdC involved in cytochrome C biogenesis